MIGNFYIYVKDGNVSEVRRLLNIKAINLDRMVGIKALAIAVDNCQEKVFAELLKYVNIYVKIGNNDATILHILVSHLNFATLYPDKAKKICNMLRILLNAEAERRIKDPQDYRPFLEQTPSASGKVPLPSIEAKAFSDLRNKIATIISEIETRYPEIINLKAQAKETANDEHKLTTNAFTTAPSPTLIYRRHTLLNDNEPLLSQQPAELSQNSNTWSAFWNKLCSFVSNRNAIDYESPVVKSR